MDIRVKYFDYPRQFAQHKKEFLAVMEETFSRGAYIMGEDLAGFEENLAQFVGSRYAVGVGNCTDALLLSLIAAGIGKDDEVISVSHTFVATIEVIHRVSAKPVLVDIAGDHNMDVHLVESAITPRTKAIMPVSLNGRSCGDIDRLVAIAKDYNLVIIEDAAQALGSSFKGKKAGTFGVAGCFSFYPAKLLGTFGDAGAVVTDSEEYAERLKMLRNHGRGKSTDIECWGLNCRMDNVHAAILNFKLAGLSGAIETRRQIARFYNEGLSDVDSLKLPPAPDSNPDYFDVYQNYEIEAQRRDELADYLSAHGIETLLPWGGKAVHQFPALGLNRFRLPRTDELFEKVLMLPLYPELSSEQLEYVIRSVRRFYLG